MKGEEKVRVRLLKPHFHNAVRRQQGSVIVVGRGLASWLASKGVGRVLAEARPGNKQRDRNKV